MDVGREVAHFLVAWEFAQGGGDEGAGGCGVASLVCQSGLEEDQFRAAQGAVLHELVEHVLGFGVGKPVQEHGVPFGEVVGASLPGVVAGVPGVLAGVVADGGVVEGVEVVPGEGHPHVGDGQHAVEHGGQGGFLLGDSAEPAAGPSVA